MFKSISALLACSLLFLNVPAASAEKAVFAGGCFGVWKLIFKTWTGFWTPFPGL